VPAVLILASAVRLGIFAAAAAQSPDRAVFLRSPDSGEYMALARSLAAGRGFTTDIAGASLPDFRRTPVYPLLLTPLVAAFPEPSSATLAAAALNLAISIATVALTFAIAARTGGRRAAIAASVVLATDLTSATYANLVLTETVFTALLVTAVLVLVGAGSVKHPPRAAARRPLAAGALLGAAALCRPIGLFLSAAASPAVIAQHWRRSRASVVFGLIGLNGIFVAVLGVWVVRNMLTFGVASLSPVGAVNLYFHRAAYVQAQLEGSDVEQVRARWEAAFAERSAGWTEMQKMSWLSQEARRILAAHPLVYLTVYARGLSRMFGPEREHLAGMLGIAPGGRLQRPVVLISWLQLAILYALAAVGTVCGLRAPSARVATILAVGLIVYLVAMAGPEVYSRFRVPLMPLLAVLAGFAFVRGGEGCPR
jgi:4-amino-4-deoxy-L-arabinose transferase-like glycosyltransferase